MVTRALRSLLAEPPPDAPPTPVWRDGLLVAAVGASLAVEAVVRDGFSLTPVAVIAVVLLAVSLLIRRTQPLAAVAIIFGALILSSLVALVGHAPALPYTLAWVLVLPYALSRWGSGREAAIGLGIMVAAAILDLIVDFTGPIDATVGVALLLFPAALGASVRYRTNARQREVEQIKLLERQQLARELHDTVAHHVSAIAVQAQAGQAVAAADPSRAVDALAVIEAAASRTLDEMRAVVGVLRSDATDDLAPQPGIDDLHRLADVGGWPTVEVRISGDLDDPGPALEATVYRLAQEAVTNAVRHARQARRIEVTVTADPGHVHLTVTDDGEPRTGDRPTPGFGLTGMRERVSLLGGTLEAGPAPETGWRVHAVLPRTGGAPS
jgi:signal transduction histidine kinase